MESILAIAGFVTVAVITPGPNNLVVLAAAARGGFASALPSIAGVVTGSLLLLFLVWVGAQVIFESLPALRSLLLAAGVLYLVWLGGGLIWRACRPGSNGDRSGCGTLPSTVLGLAVFQVLNPKSWVLVLTATTAMLGYASGPSALGTLIAMFVIIPIVCLLLWAYAGSSIADALRRPQFKRRFDCIMGGALIGSAALLVA